MQQSSNNIPNTTTNPSSYAFSSYTPTSAPQQEKSSTMSLNYVLNNGQDDGNNRFNLLKSAAALLENSSKNEPNKLPPLFIPNSSATPTVGTSSSSSQPQQSIQNLLHPQNFSNMQQQTRQFSSYLPNPSNLYFPTMPSQEQHMPPLTSQLFANVPNLSNSTSKQPSNSLPVSSTTVPTTAVTTSTSAHTPHEVSNDEKRKRVHVSRACLNCRKAHACCGEQRPCQRCVRLGIANECVDVMNKKRHKLKNDPAHSTSTILPSTSSATTVSPSHSIMTPTSVSPPLQQVGAASQEDVQKPKRRKTKKEELNIQTSNASQQLQQQQLQQIQQQLMNSQPYQSIPQLEDILARFQQKLYDTNGKMPTQEDLNTVSYLMTTYGGVIIPPNTNVPPAYSTSYPQQVSTPSSTHITQLTSSSIPSTPQNYGMSTPIASPKMTSNAEKYINSEKSFWEDDSFWGEFLAETFNSTGEAATPLKNMNQDFPTATATPTIAPSIESPKMDTPSQTVDMYEMGSTMPQKISAALLEHRQEVQKRKEEMGVGEHCPAMAVYLAIPPEEKKSISNPVAPPANVNLKNVSSFEMSIYKNFKDYFDACDKENKPVNSSIAITTQQKEQSSDAVNQYQTSAAESVNTAEMSDMELLKMKITKLEQEKDFLQSKLAMAHQLTQSLLGFSENTETETGIVVTVQGGGVVAWNTRIREKLGYDKNDLFVKVKSWRDLCQQKDLKQMFPKLVHAVRNRLPSFTTNYDFAAKDGSVIPAQATHRFCHDYKSHLPIYSVATITFL